VASWPGKFWVRTGRCHAAPKFGPSIPARNRGRARTSRLLSLTVHDNALGPIVNRAVKPRRSGRGYKALSVRVTQNCAMCTHVQRYLHQALSNCCAGPIPCGAVRLCLAYVNPSCRHFDRVISVHRIAGLRLVHNTTESHPAEITHLFIGRALRSASTACPAPRKSDQISRGLGCVP
jgi:hypothetical protein